MRAEKLRKQLGIWFTVHFIADVSVAVPLIVMPRVLLGFLGWDAVDPVAARLVAAALFGIGIESFLGRRSSLATFHAMLMLKIIWSSTAILGFAISLVEGAHGRPLGLWAFLGIFVAFNILWSWFWLQNRKLLKEERP